MDPFKEAVTTTMVGSWAAVEEHLGWLWGQGDPPPGLPKALADLLALPPVRRTMLDLKRCVRNRAFDIGNHQLRKLEGQDR